MTSLSVLTNSNYCSLAGLPESCTYLRLFGSKQEYDDFSSVENLYDLSYSSELASSRYIENSAWYPSAIIPLEMKVSGDPVDWVDTYADLQDSKQRIFLELIPLLFPGSPNYSSRILVAEPKSKLSLNIRSRYALSIASFFDADDLCKFFPLPYINLQSIDLPSDKLDLLISSEIYEHLPLYKDYLREVLRVLSPGGIHMFSCPFLWDQYQTQIRAVLNSSGDPTHLSPPEYHPGIEGNFLVFQVPGWDILDLAKEIGYTNAVVAWVSNPAAGVVGYQQKGCFTFIFQK